MITERELQEAIKECMQEPVTGTKRGTLADLIIIQDYLFGTPIYDEMYSYANKVERVVEIGGDTEFLQAINGKDAEKVWKVIDELVSATKVLQPRMYDGLIRRLEDI